MPSSRRRRQGARLVGRWAPAAVLLGLLVLAWQLVAAHNTYLIPRIGAIWAQLADHPRRVHRRRRGHLVRKRCRPRGELCRRLQPGRRHEPHPRCRAGRHASGGDPQRHPGREPRSRVCCRLRLHHDAALPGDGDNRVLPSSGQFARRAPRRSTPRRSSTSRRSTPPGSRSSCTCGSRRACPSCSRRRGSASPCRSSARSCRSFLRPARPTVSGPSSKPGSSQSTSRRFTPPSSACRCSAWPSPSWWP